MKARFFAVVALLLGLAACQSEPELVNPVFDGEVDYSLTVGVQELATRADLDGDGQETLNSAFGAIDYFDNAPAGDYRIDWSNVDLRYILEVYDFQDTAGGATYDGKTPIKDRQVKILDKYEPVVFDLRLVPGRKYHFVVFADFVDNGKAALSDAEKLGVVGIRHSVGTTLADIKVINEAINDEAGDAYFAIKDIEINNSATEPITLTRPYGKLRVVATDLAELNLNVHPGSTVVEYEAFNPNTFNAVTGKIGGTYAVKSFTTTYVEKVRDNMTSHYYTAGYDAEKVKAVDNVTERNSHITLFTDYILAENQQSTIHFTMTVNDGSGAEIKTTKFNTEIPVQRNYLTTIIGNVLTTSTEIKITIDDNFENKDNLEDEPFYVEVKEVDNTTDFVAALKEAEGEEYAIIELTNNVEWTTGGGIGSTPFIPAGAKTKGLTIEGNGRSITALGAGVGAIRMANEGKLIFNNVVFVDNTESYAESAWEFMYLEFGDNIEFNNCTFKGNIVVENADDKSDVVVFNKCVFTNETYPNTAKTDEYCAWVSDGDVTFNECSFSGNRGVKVHEAYGSEVAKLSINKCAFENLAKKPGLAIGTLNAETAVEIKDSKFINCQAGDQGLYIYETDTDVASLNSFVNQNNAVGFANAKFDKTLTLKAGLYSIDNVEITTADGAAIAIAENAEVTIYVAGDVDLNGATDGIAVPGTSKLTIEGVAETRSAGKFGTLTVTPKNGYGIGGIEADVTIKNTTIDYICGTPIQPLFVSDTKYGKSEPEGFSAIGGKKITLDNVAIEEAHGGSKAAAIGNRYWNSSEITILNSTLGDIYGGNASAAIGGSRYADDSKHDIKIKIENSTIANAVGGQAGAGIGSGYDTHCNQQNYTATNEIVIVNSTIKATGGKYAAGIGTGYHSAYLTGSIDALSTIEAIAGDAFYKNGYTTAQNIGYGIVDPAREFSGANANVTFSVADEQIAAPAIIVNDETIESALALDREYLDIQLGGDAVIEISAWVEPYYIGGASTKVLTIDGNGHKLTFNHNNGDWNYVRCKNDAAELVIKNATISNSGKNDGPWNRHDIVFFNKVTLENVTSDKAVALQNDSNLNNVVISDVHPNASEAYALWIVPHGQTVNIKNCQFLAHESKSGDRGITINDQYVDAPEKVTLNIDGLKVKSQKKAAILVKTKVGADITVKNIDLTEVKADGLNAVWVDEDHAAYADLVTVTGASKVVEGAVVDAYVISDKAGLFWFANEVNVKGNSFAGKTVKLGADIDLENEAWTPIGQTGATTFCGVFDGQGYTIFNLNVNSEAFTGDHYSSGLFGWVESHSAGNGHIKNVNINGATIHGHHNCGALVGYITDKNALVENCHVTGATVTCTVATSEANGDKAGALIGNATVATPIKNCSAANSTVSAGRDAGQVIGAGHAAIITGCSATNVEVTANGTGTGANIRNEVIGRLL